MSACWILRDKWVEDLASFVRSISVRPTLIAVPVLSYPIAIGAKRLGVRPISTIVKYDYYFNNYF
jgi:hypothetical protein